MTCIVRFDSDVDDASCKITRINETEIQDLLEAFLLSIYKNTNVASQTWPNKQEIRPRN